MNKTCTKNLKKLVGKKIIGIELSDDYAIDYIVIKADDVSVEMLIEKHAFDSSCQVYELDKDGNFK